MQEPLLQKSTSNSQSGASRQRSLNRMVASATRLRARRNSANNGSADTSSSLTTDTPSVQQQQQLQQQLSRQRSLSGLVSRFKSSFRSGRTEASSAVKQDHVAGYSSNADDYETTQIIGILKKGQACWLIVYFYVTTIPFSRMGCVGGSVLSNIQAYAVCSCHQESEPGASSRRRWVSTRCFAQGDTNNDLVSPHAFAASPSKLCVSVAFVHCYADHVRRQVRVLGSL